MTDVTIRYWAAAKAAAGVAEESLDADTLAAALSAALARRGADPRLRAVLARSSFLADGSAVSVPPRTCRCPTARRSRYCRRSPEGD